MIIKDQTSALSFRWIAMIIGAIAALVLTFLADPDTAVLLKIPVGASVILLIKSLVYYALAAGVLHFGFKTMFDYIDRSELIKKAIADGGSGNVLIGLGLFALAFAVIYSTLIAL